jgi:hypothetical protein
LMLVHMNKFTQITRAKWYFMIITTAIMHSCRLCIAATIECCLLPCKSAGPCHGKPKFLSLSAQYIVYQLPANCLLTCEAIDDALSYKWFMSSSSFRIGASTPFLVSKRRLPGNLLKHVKI